LDKTNSIPLHFLCVPGFIDIHVV